MIRGSSADQELVGRKPGQNLPTSRRDPIHKRMPHNAYIRLGWYGERTVKESYLLQLPLKGTCIVHVRLPIGRCHEIDHPPICHARSSPIR